MTDTVPEFVAAEHEIPMMRDNSYGGYIRQDQRSGLIGVFENVDAPAVWRDGAAWDSEHELFEPALTAAGTGFEVSILERPRRARVLAEPAHDPKNLRLRA